MDRPKLTHFIKYQQQNTVTRSNKTQWDDDDFIYMKSVLINAEVICQDFGNTNIPKTKITEFTNQLFVEFVYLFHFAHHHYKMSIHPAFHYKKWPL